MFIYFWFKFFKKLYCNFSHYHLSPYTLFYLCLPPPSPHCCPSPQVLRFCLAPFLLPCPKPPPEVSACSPSISLSLFRLLGQFVHKMPQMSEVIWYLSFSDWLMSLSLMLSRSIRAVAKGEIFFKGEKNNG